MGLCCAGHGTGLSLGLRWSGREARVACLLGWAVLGMLLGSDGHVVRMGC
jgi:hypothetical protein